MTLITRSLHSWLFVLSFLLAINFPICDSVKSQEEEETAEFLHNASPMGLDFERLAAQWLEWEPSRHSCSVFASNISSYSSPVSGRFFSNFVPVAIDRRSATESSEVAEFSWNRTTGALHLKAPWPINGTTDGEFLLIFQAENLFKWRQYPNASFSLNANSNPEKTDIQGPSESAAASDDSNTSSNSHMSGRSFELIVEFVAHAGWHIGVAIDPTASHLNSGRLLSASKPISMPVYDANRFNGNDKARGSANRELEARLDLGQLLKASERFEDLALRIHLQRQLLVLVLSLESSEGLFLLFPELQKFTSLKTTQFLLNEPAHGCRHSKEALGCRPEDGTIPQHLLDTNEVILVDWTLGRLVALSSAIGAQFEAFIHRGGSILFLHDTLKTGDVRSSDDSPLIRLFGMKRRPIPDPDPDPHTDPYSSVESVESEYTHEFLSVPLKTAQNDASHFPIVQTHRTCCSYDLTANYMFDYTIPNPPILLLKSSDSKAREHAVVRFLHSRGSIGFLNTGHLFADGPQYMNPTILESEMKRGIQDWNFMINFLHLLRRSKSSRLIDAHRGAQESAQAVPSPDSQSSPRSLDISLRVDLLGVHFSAPRSCLEILYERPSAQSGWYDIDIFPHGAVKRARTRVYCLMDKSFEGGGWTLVWGNLALAYNLEDMGPQYRSQKLKPNEQLSRREALYTPPRYWVNPRTMDPILGNGLERTVVYTGIELWKPEHFGRQGQLLYIWGKDRKSSGHPSSPRQEYLTERRAVVNFTLGNETEKHRIHFHEDSIKSWKCNAEEGKAGSLAPRTRCELTGKEGWPLTFVLDNDNPFMSREDQTEWKAPWGVHVRCGLLYDSPYWYHHCHGGSIWGFSRPVDSEPVGMETDDPVILQRVNSNSDDMHKYNENHLFDINVKKGEAYVCMGYKSGANWQMGLSITAEKYDEYQTGRPLGVAHGWIFVR